MNQLITRNPYSGVVLEKYACFSPEQLDRALNIAKGRYSEWSSRTLETRIEGIQRVRMALERDLELHAELITSEMGKPISESRSELRKCLSLFDFYLENVKEMLSPVKEDLGDKQVLHILEPTGAVLGIMPWNFPYWQVMRFAVPTLLLGNVVMLKHSPLTTGCGIAIQTLFEEGAPGIFQTLLLEIPQVETVIAHPIVQGVCLTGSARAGRAVASLSGKYLKKSVLELGGTDAFVILGDADLEGAIKAAFQSRILNAGQSCIAAKRIFVPESRMDLAIDQMKQLIQQINHQDPMRSDTTMGPLASAEFAIKLAQQQRRLLDGGASMIIEGKRENAMYGATLVTSEGDHPVNQEELFGPVLNLIPWEDEDLLLKQVNHTPFGLGGAVWSNNPDHAIHFARGMETGAIAINELMKSDPRVPFGGIRQSGYGREMGLEGIKSFANLKVILV